MPGVGIEPTWDFSRGILSPLRLPFRHPGAISDQETGGVEPNVYRFDRKAPNGPYIIGTYSRFSPQKLNPPRRKSSRIAGSGPDRRGHRGLRVDLDALRQAFHKG